MENKKQPFGAVFLFLDLTHSITCLPAGRTQGQFIEGLTLKLGRVQ